MVLDFFSWPGKNEGVSLARGVYSPFGFIGIGQCIKYKST